MRGGWGAWRAGVWGWKVSQPRAWFSPFRYLQGTCQHLEPGTADFQGTGGPMRRAPEFFLLRVILSAYYLVCWSLLGKSIRSCYNYVTWTRGVHGSWLNSTSSWSQTIFRCCRSVGIAEVSSSLVSSPLHLFFLSTVNFSFTVFPPIAFEPKAFEALPWPVQPK